MKRVGNQSGAAMLMTMSLALAGAGASAPNNDAPATANAANDDLTSRITVSSTCLFDLLTSSNVTFGLVCRDHTPRQFVGLAQLRRMAIPVSWANRHISSFCKAQSIDASLAIP